MQSGRQRAQTNVIGFVIIFAGVLGLSGVILSTVVVPLVDQPLQTDPEFDASVTGSDNNVTITYTDGEPFTTENAREIRVIREGSSASLTVSEFPIQPGDALITDVPMDESPVLETGAELRVVYIDAAGGSETADRVFLPTREQSGEIRE